MRDAQLARPALDALVRDRLRSVLISAHRHVPYYRDAMDRAGYVPARDYRGPDDLKHLPITRKETVKTNSATFIRDGADLGSCFADATSGSTGIPLRVYRTREERAIEIA